MLTPYIAEMKYQQHQGNSNQNHQQPNDKALNGGGGGGGGAMGCVLCQVIYKGMKSRDTVRPRKQNLITR